MNLMRITNIILTIIIFFFLSNCASFQNYILNRGNDLKDIVNIGIEKDVYGVNAQVAIGVIGFQNAYSGTGFGLRYGHFGKYKTGDDKNAISFFDGTEKKEIYFGNSILFSSTNYHEPQTSKNSRASLKKIKRLEFLFRRCVNDIYYKEKIFPIQYTYYRGQRCFFSESYIHNLRSLELSVGMYIGLRIGFNLNEFIDFIAGVAGYDLYYDDYKTTYNELPQALPEKPNWESKFDSADKEMDARLKK